MPTTCIVPGCKSRHVKNAGVSYHQFPKNEALAKKWIDILNLENVRITESAKVCSKHFSPQCFMVVLRTGRKTMKSNSVPNSAFPQTQEIKIPVDPSCCSLNTVSCEITEIKDQDQGRKTMKSNSVPKSVSPRVQEIKIPLDSSSCSFDTVSCEITEIEIPQIKKECCVPRCDYTSSNCPTGTVFYSFPCPHEELELRQKWIHWMRYYSLDDPHWLPRDESSICSLHFVEGQEFVPSVFDSRLKKQIKTEPNFEERAEESGVVSIIITNVISITPVIETKDFSQQANFEYQEDSFIFDVTKHNGGDVSVQCNIPHRSYFGCKAFQGYHSLKEDDRQFREVSGVSVSVFHVLLELIPGDRKYTHRIMKENQLLMFLMKMRLGVSFATMAVFFGIDKNAVVEIFITILSQLRKSTLYSMCWPTRDSVQVNMPDCIGCHYPNTRVIIDCITIKLAKQSKCDKRYFRGVSAVKCVIGMSPNGSVSFVSNCQDSSLSNSVIIEGSGLLELLEKGDVILTDVFYPGVKLSKDNAMVVAPGIPQNHSITDELEPSNIGSVRMHVEKCVQQIRNFHILVHKIPVELLPHLDKICFLVCVLTNLMPLECRKKNETSQVFVLMEA